MATPSEKRAILSVYYELREITSRMGIRDEQSPRYHSPIKYEESSENLSVNDITVRIKEELDLMRQGLAARAHEMEIIMRNNKRSRQRPE